MRHLASVPIEQTTASQEEDFTSPFRETFLELRSLLDQLQLEFGASAPHGGHCPQKLLRARRLRERFFDPDLFSDPAWDILLDLYNCAQKHQRVSVSSLCHASATPPTTALRWIKTLENRGLVAREPDRMDGRRSWMSLTDTGMAAMQGYFAALP